MTIFSSCVVDNKTYQNWKFLKDPDLFELACAHDEVEKILEDIIHFAKNTNSLMILDDCAASKDVKNRTSELVKLGFHGRHIGLSTIVIMQQLTSSIAKPYRIIFQNSLRYIMPVEMIQNIYSTII